MTDQYSLTRSIIHDCPALKLPQSFVEQLGNTAQIVALKGASPEMAQKIVDALNAAPVPSPQVAQAELSDEQIDALMPEPDGSAEANVARVEVAPGVWGTEHDEVDAWSRPLVRQVVRAALAQYPKAGDPAWQPIETAPKDLTEILGLDRACGALVLYWDEDRWSDGMSSFHRDPSHWMPIPPAPAIPSPAAAQSNCRHAKDQTP